MYVMMRTLVLGKLESCAVTWRKPFISPFLKEDDEAENLGQCIFIFCSSFKANQLLKIRTMVPVSTRQQTCLKWTKFDKERSWIFITTTTPEYNFIPATRLHRALSTPLPALKSQHDLQGPFWVRIFYELIHLYIIFQMFQQKLVESM